MKNHSVVNVCSYYTEKINKDAVEFLTKKVELSHQVPAV